MKTKIFKVVLIILLFSYSQCYCQTIDKEKVVYIRFFTQLSNNSVIKLMSIIDDSIKKGKERIVILISSSGGSVDAGIAAYNYLKGVPLEIWTHNFGSVDSMAIVLFCSGSKRFAVPNSRFLFHDIGMNISSQRMDEKKLDEQIKSMQIQRLLIAKIISENSSKTQGDIAKSILETKTVNAEEAKEWGIVQDIKSELFEKGIEVFDIVAP